MNKKIIKFAIAVATCVALTGTTIAAPAPRGGRPPAPAKQHQKAPPPKPAGHKAPRAPHVAPAHHVVHVHHPAPPPRPCPPPPPPPPPVIVHHVEHHEATGWAVLGAAVIGGIVGALVN